jgi:hypothetical protein
VLFYGTAPYAYLMANEMIPCTPTVWRITHAANTTNWAMDYFERDGGRRPDQIYFMALADYEDYCEQPKDDRFVMMIDEYYELVNTEENEDVPIIIYQLKQN